MLAKHLHINGSRMQSKVHIHIHIFIIIINQPINIIYTYIQFVLFFSLSLFACTSLLKLFCIDVLTKIYYIIFIEIQKKNWIECVRKSNQTKQTTKIWTKQFDWILLFLLVYFLTWFGQFYNQKFSLSMLIGFLNSVFNISHCSHD